MRLARGHFAKATRTPVQRAVMSGGLGRHASEQGSLEDRVDTRPLPQVRRG